MRLHSLSVTAFGPFADTVDVDFDTLSDAGLFLLCGATGAGKSSILDAVCFALYGEIPGDRAAARHLRCDSSPATLAPRVFLDVTLGSRRFHLTRSPSWQRPKKRGTGTTSQQASVLVEEIVDGTATHLSHRLDEAGHLVSGLLGMNLSQFTQVAMLPQGRFQDFLRARSEERHLLLQKLFRTGRFEDVERWLRDQRIQHRRASETHADRIVGVLHRLSEVSGEDLPLSLEDLDLHRAAEDGELSAAADHAGDVADKATATAQSQLNECTARLHAAAHALDDARHLVTLQDRHAEASSALQVLGQANDAIGRRREEVIQARRATPISVLHQQEVRARSRVADAERHVASTRRAALAVLGETAHEDEFRLRRSACQDALVRATAMTGVEAELLEVVAHTEALAAERDTLTDQVAQLRDRLARLPFAVAVALERVTVATRAALDLPPALELVSLLRAREEAFDRVEQISVTIDAAHNVLRQAVDNHQHLRQNWLDLQEERIQGMAAELATALAVGESCPVCGSCDHPHRAALLVGAPTAAQEKAARKHAEDADVTRQAYADQVRGLETSLAVACEQAGTRSRTQVNVDLASLRARTDLLQAHADDRAAAARIHAELFSRQRHDESALVSALARHRVVEEALIAARRRCEELRASVTEVLEGHRDLDALITTVKQQQATLDAALDAVAEQVRASAQLAEVADDLRRTADACGFDDPGRAIQALRSDSVLVGLEASLAEHDQSVRAATTILAEPDLGPAASRPAPDLTALSTAHLDATERLADTEATHRRAVGTRLRVGDLRDQLLEALTAWAPVRAAYALLADVASFVEGKSCDNRSQMRLSAYVLSWRLGQVVDAANLRLAGMTDQRYALEHSALRGAGETRGGLSLRVRDDWSGETRDPVTLSGGETFVVSLALALGLTDVVTQEAGGADIGTLFIDEGFGSLDADTLDDVMDTLDALREGGRVVGIVSHVPELRTRITAQLRVDKSRDGSRVQQLLTIA
jgi:DNA repair protein SbcC/Rad50